MKRILQLFLTLVIFLVMSGYCLAQKTKTDRVSVPFSDPSKPGLVEVSLMNGSITVTGYTGKEVIIVATTAMEKLTISEEKVGKAKGMKKISYNSTGLRVEEEDNVIEIRTQSMKRSVSLTIQVPTNSDLNLSTMQSGDIFVENVNGEMDVNNMNGKVILKNVSGSVVAHSLNDDLEVILIKITPGKPMSFSTMNGDVDVTLPANTSANIKMRSTNGDIFSDFDIKITPSPAKRLVENNRKQGGKYQITFDEYLIGTLNGGGQELTFKTFQGDIYIRKGK